MVNFSNDKSYDGLRSIFRERKYFVASLGEIGYKSVNTWEEAGILLENTEKREGGKWRKFDLMELCWFRIIHELRGVGIGLEKLKKIKTSLFYSFGHSDGKSLESKNLIEFFIAEVLDKKDVILVVSPDGRSTMILEEDYISSQLKFLLPTTLITLSLNRLLGNLFNTPDLYSKNTLYFPFKENSKEYDLLTRVLSDKEIKEIKLKIKDNKIRKIDYVSSIENPENIFESLRKMLKENPDQDFQIKQNKGKVSYLERVEKS
jgi:DNA-binding transcriptional MerR regulator